MYFMITESYKAWLDFDATCDCGYAVALNLTINKYCLITAVGTSKQTSCSRAALQAHFFKRLPFGDL